MISYVFIELNAGKLDGKNILRLLQGTISFVAIMATRNKNYTLGKRKDTNMFFLILWLKGLCYCHKLIPLHAVSYCQVP